MRRALLVGVFLFVGCSAAEVKQDATVRCRDLGYLGALKDAGAWYCYQDRLDVLEREAVPKKAPKSPLFTP